MSERLTFTYTVELTAEESRAIRRDQDVAPDGTVTARTYGTGTLGLIVSRHKLPAVYRGKTTAGHYRGETFPALTASIKLSSAGITISDGTSGQDRKSYTDDQDRESYTVTATAHYGVPAGPTDLHAEAARQRSEDRRLTVRYVNEHLGGDPGRLLGKTVRTPKGFYGVTRGTVREIYTSASGVYRASVDLDASPTVRERFNLADLELDSLGIRPEPAVTVDITATASDRHLTVRYVNEHLGGDTGRLLGKTVRTPDGREGKVREVYGGANGVYRATVSVLPKVTLSRNPRGKRERFNLADLELI